MKQRHAAVQWLKRKCRNISYQCSEGTTTAKASRKRLQAYSALKLYRCFTEVSTVTHLVFADKCLTSMV